MVAGVSADTVFGGAGNDTIFGGLTSNFGFSQGVASLNFSLDRSDVLFGDAGDDLLDGAGGNDTLVGGAGGDTLIGGVGVDILTGGPGADIFRFGGIGGGPVPDTGVGQGNRDIITDFREGDDRIDLTFLSFGGPATWSSEREDGDTIVRVTTAGPEPRVGEIELLGVHLLGDGDFIV